MKNESPHSRAPIQLFRIAALVVPSAVAWDTAFSAPHPSQLTTAVTYTLAPLWVLMAGALLARLIDGLVQRHRGAPGSLLDHVDVLTASGSALAWFSGGAIAASIIIGWASLSVVGLMGMALLHLVVLWTCAVARGADPFRRAAVSRRFVPEHAVEGAPLTEELHLSEVRIPAGFRLFVSGRVGPRWATSRYVIGDAESGGEIVTEREIGPALRGEHRAEPLSLWLQDVFGLCHTPRFSAGEAKLTVLPKARAVDGMDTLLAQGGSLLEPRPASKLPTEGTFRLREYQPGDDARRIHWLRSLAAREVVMRMPDELPPDRPRVRLVLDTFLPGVDMLSCAAPAELLDALVQVWLGAARALVESGARVTMVAAAPRGDGVARVTLPFHARMPSPALRLGASVRWQDEMPAADLVDRDPAVVVSYRLQPDPKDSGTVRWIIVPEPMWTRLDAPPQMASPALLQYPVGSADNRWSRRRRDRIARERARRHHQIFGDITAHVGARRAGSFFAWPQGRDRARLEAVS